MVFKASIVIPIFKGGGKTLISNIRPISKQNVMSKIMENIIANKLSLLCKILMIDEQHSFVAGRSVTSNLLLYHDYINSVVEEGLQVDAVYTNFRKAFDSVNQSLLIAKLQTYDIDGSFLQWSSYLVIL